MNSLFNLFGSLLNKHGRYKVFGKTIKYNNFNNGTSSGFIVGVNFVYNNLNQTLSLSGTSTSYWTKNFQFDATIPSGHKIIIFCDLENPNNVYHGSRLRSATDYLDIGSTFNNKIITTTKDWTYLQLYGNPNIDYTGLTYKHLHIVDLTILFGAGNEPATTEQFYATDLGKEIQKGFVPPYSPTNAIYEADLSEATFKNDDGTQTQTVSILQNGQPLRIGGIGTAKDHYLNASGKVNRAIGKRAYQSGDENDTSVITDMTNTWYVLQTPTTEQANSVMLRKGFTKCYDKNNLELEIEVIDSLNFSNKIVQGKNSPTITAEKVITKGFTSGGEHFTQLYIYEDGEIWYVNGDGSAQAYASGVWELEYKQLQFDNKVSLTESERNALLNIYDLI